MPDTPVEATAADLARRAKKEANDPDVVAAFHAAVELVDEAVVDAWRPVPSYVRRECVLSAGYAILDRTKSSHGVGQLTTVEGGAVVRAPRDPKASIRTILAEYVLGFG